MIHFSWENPGEGQGAARGRSQTGRRGSGKGEAREGPRGTEGVSQGRSGAGPQGMPGESHGQAQAEGSQGRVPVGRTVRDLATKIS